MGTLRGKAQWRKLIMKDVELNMEDAGAGVGCDNTSWLALYFPDVCGVIISLTL